MPRNGRSARAGAECLVSVNVGDSVVNGKPELIVWKISRRNREATLTKRQIGGCDKFVKRDADMRRRVRRLAAFSSQHRQPARLGTARKRFIERGHLIVA